MIDEAKTLQDCVDKLATLMELTDQLPLEKRRSRLETSIQVIYEAIQVVARQQRESEDVRRLVEEAKEAAKHINKTY
jgi:hypothetical protein